MSEKDFGRLFAEFVTQQIGTKETDSIEEQYLNNLTKTVLTIDKMGTNPPDAYIQEKLIPVLKEFVAKINEILKGE